MAARGKAIRRLRDRLPRIGLMWLPLSRRGLRMEPAGEGALLLAGWRGL
ncbi:hypothetical protein [Geomesophilobacter sediminis]|nr:hypothetical protein [Geomesophilobacter sediminis]